MTRGSHCRGQRAVASLLNGAHIFHLLAIHLKVLFDTHGHYMLFALCLQSGDTSTCQYDATSRQSSVAVIVDKDTRPRRRSCVEM